MLNKTLFVELDSIFDTRLATLYNKFGEDINKILPIYKKRNIDSFTPLINNADFIELYRKRDKDTLRNSLLTPVFPMLEDFVIKAINDLRTNPYPQPPKIILNTHPYNLTLEEKQLFLNLILSKTGDKVDIEIVDMPNKDINPKYLSENVELLIKYDYTEWFEDQALHNTYIDHKCPDVKLITPGILCMDNKSLLEVIEQEKKSPMSALDSFKFIFADLIEIEFSNASLFSYKD